MNLFKQELSKYNLPMVDVDQYVEDPLFKVKITIDGLENWAWYISQWDGDTYVFGYVVGLYPELGYFDLIEILLTAKLNYSRIRFESINIKLNELKKLYE